jgi:hypothetical protein
MRSIRLQFLLSFLLISLFMSCASGHRSHLNGESMIKPGEILPQVSCTSDTLVKYALFLPSAFTPERSWPLLICFDPHAEGLLPVNLFREQAEKYGFILVGSNTSKNGMSINETTTIYRKILSDLQNQFPVDSLSVYVAGFSGGSRVAGAIAITEGNIAGVIGCGAGLPNINQQPVKPFSYLAVSGIQDFNYNELKQVDESLEKAGYIHHLLIFDGIHQWPTKDIIPDIFTWLCFDRMRKRTIPPDRNMINRFIDANYSKSEEAGKNGDVLNQQSILLKMKDYLEGLTDVAPLESEIAKLDKDKLVIQQKEALQLIFDRERSLQSDYSGKMQQETPGWWSKEADKLHKMADKQPITDESRMYKRVLGFLSLNAYMQCNSALKQEDMASASRFIEIYSLVDPTNAEHRYMAAIVSMKQGNREQSILYLQEADSLGFKEFQRLKKDPVFEPLHSDQRYIKLLAGH